MKSGADKMKVIVLRRIFVFEKRRKLNSYYALFSHEPDQFFLMSSGASVSSVPPTPLDPAIESENRDAIKSATYTVYLVGGVIFVVLLVCTLYVGYLALEPVHPAQPMLPFFFTPSGDMNVSLSVDTWYRTMSLSRVDVVLSTGSRLALVPHAVKQLSQQEANTTVLWTFVPRTMENTSSIVGDVVVPAVSTWDRVELVVRRSSKLLDMTSLCEMRSFSSSSLRSDALSIRESSKDFDYYTNFFVATHVGRFFSRTILAREERREEAGNDNQSSSYVILQFDVRTGSAWKSFSSTMTDKYTMGMFIFAGPMNWAMQKASRNKVETALHGPRNAVPR